MTTFKYLVPFFVLSLPVQGFSQTQNAFSSNLYLRAAGPYASQHAPEAGTVLLQSSAENFAAHHASWRKAGYKTVGSINVAWGNFTDYASGVWDGRSHFDEIQLTADDREFEHAGGGYYFVPSQTYLNYLKQKIEAVIDAGAEAVCLEQPFFWSRAGYSDGFKREWENFYETEWQAPEEDVAAQFQAEQLKFELELRAVSELAAHAKRYAQGRNREVRCYVSVLSNVQYARAGKVGPQAELMYIPECDGIFAQIPAEALPVPYAGLARVRPFETAWLDYGLIAQAARGHEKQIVFGIESASVRENEEILKTRVLAALFYPEGSHYEAPAPITEIIPSAKANGHAPAHAAAMSRRLILQHVLQNAPQQQATWQTGETGIGILMSDAVMLQRAQPDSSDTDLASFYGLALPLLKHGVFVQPLLFENLSRPGYLLGYKILFLSYRAMKPQQPQWHERLATWVKTGGTLIFVDDERDPFNQAPGWWREPSYNYARPSEHLFQLLGLPGGPKPGRNRAGMGAVIYVDKNPATFARSATGPQEVLALAASAMPHGRIMKQQNYFKLQRGPYVIAHQFDETADSTALRLTGDWIDLFDAALPRISNKSLRPGESALLFEVSKRDSTKTQVLAAAANISQIRRSGAQHVFSASGPAHARALVVLSTPHSVPVISAASNGTVVPVQKKSERNLVWLEFELRESPVEITIRKE